MIFFEGVNTEGAGDVIFRSIQMVGPMVAYPFLRMREGLLLERACPSL
jgi:hypothetical protein